MDGPGHLSTGGEVQTPEGQQGSPPRGQRPPHQGGSHPGDRPPEAPHTKGRKTI